MWRSFALASAVAIAAGAWVRFGPLPAGLLDGVNTPPPLSSIAAAACCTRRCHPTGPASSRSIRRRCRRCSWPRPWRPRIAASTRISAWTLSRWRALPVRTWSKGQIVEGGSTITQQVAKLLLQRREGIRPRGFRAKVREMVAGPAARAPLQQDGNPRPLFESRVVRQPGDRRGPREPGVFRRRRLDADAGAGRFSRGAAAAARGLQSLAEPGVGATPPADGAATHGRGGRAHRRAAA